METISVLCLYKKYKFKKKVKINIYTLKITKYKLHFLSSYNHLI